MGKRTYDLTKMTITELAALIASAVIPVDDSSLSAGEAKHVKLSELLLDGAMDDSGDTLANRTNVVTPKALKATVASEDVTGVIRVATEANLGSLDNDNAVVANNLRKALEKGQEVYHVTGTPSQGVLECDIRFIRQGQVCFMTGRFKFDFSIWGQAQVAAITFANVPAWAKPATKAAVAGAFDVQAPTVPLNGNCRMATANDLRIDLFSYTTLSGTGNIVVSSCWFVGETA